MFNMNNNKMLSFSKESLNQQYVYKTVHPASVSGILHAYLIDTDIHGFSSLPQKMGVNDSNESTQTFLKTENKMTNNSAAMS